ncbi:MAG: hypothetical protein ACFB2Y_02660 [Fulvivirga sp.]
MENLEYTPILKKLLQNHCGREYEGTKMSDEQLFSDYLVLKEKGNLYALFHSEWLESEERQSANQAEFDSLVYNPLLKSLLQIYCGRAYEEIGISDEELFVEYLELKREGILDSLFYSEWLESEDRLKNIYN